MDCEICSDQNIVTFATHLYVYDPNGLEKNHFYCEEHFKEFCKMVAEE